MSYIFQKERKDELGPEDYDIVAELPLCIRGWVGIF